MKKLLMIVSITILLTHCTKLKFDGYSEEELAGFEKVDYKKLAETAINYSDAVIKGSTELDEDLLKLIEDSKLPTLEYSDGEYKEQYNVFNLCGISKR